MQTFQINDLPATLNKLNNLHFIQRARMKEAWEVLVSDACREYGIKPVKRVSVTLALFFPDKRRRDLDNYGGLGFKFVCDGLVKCGVLVDDSVDEVVELRVVYGGISKPAHVLVTLVEME